LWAGAGACWLVSLFLPWTSKGALSSATLVDAVRLIRRGSVDALVPPAAAAVLLVPALAGIVLIGLAGFAGRAVEIARVVAGAVGAVASLGLGLPLTGADPTAAGPGAWVALVGVVAVVAALGTTVLHARSGPGARSARTG
jgi:hypothetical protein